MDEKQAKRLHSRKKLGVMVVTLVVLAVLALAYFYTEGIEDAIPNRIVIAFCGEGLPDAQASELEKALNVYLPQDERKPVVLSIVAFPRGYNDPQGEALLELLQTMQADGANLYLLDTEIARLLDGRVELENLSARFVDQMGIVEQTLYPLAQLPLAQKPGFENLQGCYFALQQANAEAATRNVQTLAHYHLQAALLRNLVYDQPGEPVSPNPL